MSKFDIVDLSGEHLAQLEERLRAAENALSTIDTYVLITLDGTSVDSHRASLELWEYLAERVNDRRDRIQDRPDPDVVLYKFTEVEVDE